MGLRAALFFSLLLPCVPKSFYNPFFGLVIYTILSFTTPQWYAWGAGYMLPSAELIAIPMLLGYAVFNRNWLSMMSRESVLLVIFWAWTVVTTLNSVATPLFAPHATLTWGRLEFVSKVFLIAVVTVGLVDTVPRFRTFIITIAGCFSFFVVKAIPFMIMTHGSERLYGSPRSAVADNNDLGLALNMTLPLLFFLAHTENRPKLKRLFWALFILLIPGIFCTYSRGALVGLVTVMGMMVMQSRQRVVLIGVAVLGILVAVLFAPDKWKSRMNLADTDTTIDSSAQSRFNSWTFSWNLALDFPIAGGGYDTFTRALFDRYAPDSRDVHGPHSIYFGVLAEHGFIGFFLYMGLVASCFLTLRKVTIWARYHGDEVAENYAKMLKFSIIAFLTSGLFLGRQYFDYYFTLVACISILKRVCFEAWDREQLTIDGRPFFGEPEVESPSAIAAGVS